MAGQNARPKVWTKSRLVDATDRDITLTLPQLQFRGHAQAGYDEATYTVTRVDSSGHAVKVDVPQNWTLNGALGNAVPITRGSVTFRLVGLREWAGSQGSADGVVDVTDLSSSVRTSLTRADGAVQRSSNLSDVENAATARTNLGLGAAATKSMAQVAADSALTNTYAAKVATRRPGLQAFWNDLAQIDSKQVGCLFVGHSFMEGYRQTSVSKTIAAYFRDEMRRNYQPAGITGGFGYSTQTSVSSFTDDPLAAAGGGTWLAGYGLGRHVRSMSGAGQKLTWTNITCTGFDIHYLQVSGGAVGHYTVDGGAPTTFTTTGATTDAGKVVQVRGISAGTHTVEVGWSSGGTCYIGGLHIYNGDEAAGLHTYISATGGTQSSYYTDPAAAAISWMDAVATIQPSLVVICDMVNDAGNNPSPIASSTTKTNLQTLISNVKAKCTIAPSFVIVTEFQPNTSLSEPWANFVAVPPAIAASDTTVSVLQLTDYIGVGPTAGSTPLVNADGIHLSNAGARLVGNALASFVSPTGV